MGQTRKDKTTEPDENKPVEFAVQDDTQVIVSFTGIVAFATAEEARTFQEQLAELCKDKLVGTPSMRLSHQAPPSQVKTF